MITVFEREDRLEVECGHCGTVETVGREEKLAGFVLTAGGDAGAHCCWCGRDGMGLFEDGVDELSSCA